MDDSAFRHVGWRIASYAFLCLVAVLVGFGMGVELAGVDCPPDAECDLVFLGGAPWSLAALAVVIVACTAVETVVRRRARRDT